MKPRLWLYFVAFAVIIVAAGAVTGWHRADWWLYAHLPQGESPRLHKDIAILDVPDDPDRERFRGFLAEALHALAQASDPPRIVLLDFQIDREPRGLAPVERAVRELQNRRVAVYAAVNPLLEGGHRTNPDFLADHAQTLYTSVLDGYGHTVFDLLYDSLKYDPYLDLGRGISLAALPIRVAEMHYGLPPAAFTRPILVHAVPAAAFDERVVRYRNGRFESAAAQSGALPEWRDKVVIVANLTRDRPPSKPLTGPLLLASALNERISTKDALQTTEVIEGPALLVSMIAAFTLITLGIFWVLYSVVPSTHTHTARLPLVSVTAAVFMFCAMSALLYKLGRVYPQVTLAMIAIVTTGMLAWVYTRRHLAWLDEQEEPAQVVEEYDVFISYSRTPENAAWVTANVYEPLRQVRTHEGRALRIFFDTQALRVGDKWFRKLRHAINASRFFIAVYSDDYFRKAFCRYEMDRALLKQARLPDAEFILPIARVTTGIPEDYEEVQFIDVSRDPKFIETIAHKIVAALAMRRSEPVLG